MKLKNLNALITGGSQGLGKVIAEFFLREGANVAICSRGERELLATRDELAKKFPSQKVFAKTCDVSSESQVNELVAFALRELGSLNALVLNAGIYGPMGATESVSLDEWKRALDINLYGVLLPCRAVIPHFKKSRRAKNNCFKRRRRDKPFAEHQRLCRIESRCDSSDGNAGGRIEKFHVDVNAIAPGALATRLVDEVFAAGAEKVGAAFFEKNKTWKEKGAVPLELGANLAVYLASAESDGITGKLISAQWDPWEKLHEFKNDLGGDIYTLRRIVPKDRGKTWGDK